MTSQLGSLPEFLKPIKKLRILTKESISKAFIKDISAMNYNTRTPPPKTLKEIPNSFKIMSFGSHRKFRRKEVLSPLPPLSPLGVFDKIREDLRNQQRLLRCMHSTIREEERQKTQALLEQRALDTVLKSMNDDIHHPQVYSKKVFTGKIIHTKKTAEQMNILSNEKQWIYKRKAQKLDLSLLY